jgi:long-chain acyl-CoA synthetase
MNLALNSGPRTARQSPSALSAVVDGAGGTLPGLLRYWARERGLEVALRWKVGGKWMSHTWRDYHDSVIQLAMGLQRSGFKRGDCLAIAGENSPEWMFADIAAQALGGIVVGVYPTSTVPEVRYLLNHSRTSWVICGDAEQLRKVRAARDDGEGLRYTRHIVCVDMAGIEPGADAVVDYRDLVDKGKRELQKPGTARTIDAAIDALDRHATAIVVYTSGTTNLPKGVRISSRGVLLTCSTVLNQFDLDCRSYKTVCYLPLCHLGERMFSTIHQLITGGEVSFIDPVNLPSALRETTPFVLLGMPRIYEKMRNDLTALIARSHWLFRKAYALGFSMTQSMVDKEDRGKVPSWYELAVKAIVRAAIFRRLHVSLGLQATRYRFCGGACVPLETLRFFAAIGLPIYQLYGLTESGGIIAIQTGAHRKLGCTGVPFSNVEVRLAADGELLIRSEGLFQGYLHDEQATAETLVDHWLHTGDVAERVASGELRIIDRKKEIIITSGGKNIAPSKVEGVLKACPFIQEAVVIGESRHYLTALVQIDSNAVGRWAAEKGLAATDLSTLARLPEVQALIADQIKAANEKLSRVENVRKFYLLPRALSRENGEITATNKLRRRIIEPHFAAEIAAMYE